MLPLRHRVPSLPLEGKMSSKARQMRWSEIISAVDNVTAGMGFGAVIRKRLTATPGARPKKRKGRLYRVASALEFAPLRGANSVGSQRSFVSAKQGVHPLARVPALFV